MLISLSVGREPIIIGMSDLEEIRRSEYMKQETKDYVLNFIAGYEFERNYERNLKIMKFIYKFKKRNRRWIKK